MKYDPDFQYDPNFKLTVKHPIWMGDGFVGVGKYVTTTPMPLEYTTIQHRRIKQAPHAVLEQFGLEDCNYGNPTHNKLLCDALGPSFPRRWAQAQVHVFERPLVKLMGGTRFRQISMFYSGKRMVHRFDIWLWLWYNRAKLEQVIRDGYTHMLPLLYYLKLELDDQPIQTLRQMFGKGRWKALCAVHPSKVISATEMAVGATRNTESRLNRLSLYTRIPTTLHELVVTMREPELEFLVELAAKRPQPYRNILMYDTLCHAYEYLTQYGPENGIEPKPTMTPEQVNRAHGRLMVIHEEQHQKRMKAYDAEYEQEFQPMRPVPWDVQNIKSRLVARLLRTKKDYYEQGKDQGHCVGSYFVNGATEQCYTYSIETPEGKVISTVMCDSVDGRIMQHYGKHNSPVTNQDAVDLAHMLTGAIATAAGCTF